MKSGLDGRNNCHKRKTYATRVGGSLNEVRPRWPEQSTRTSQDTTSSAQVSMKSGLDGRNNLCGEHGEHTDEQRVSMKSGLDGRNNTARMRCGGSRKRCLNEVRPRWPEQSMDTHSTGIGTRCLNEVRPRWPEQYVSPRSQEQGV